MARAAQLQAEDVKAWEEQEAADAEATTDATDTDGATDAASPLAVAEAARSRLAALGLKDGEKLRLNLGHAMEGRGHRHTPTLSASSPGVKAGSGGDGGLLLPPPPGDRSAAPVVAGFGEKERGGGWGEGEEEWGDFVS